MAGSVGCRNTNQQAVKGEDGVTEMIAYCGIKCQECGAFIATMNNDDAKRNEVAEEWAKMYNPDIKPEDINCEGCLSEGGVLFSHCNVCGIRKCAGEKAVVNCAHCPDYACDKLIEFLKMVPDAKTTLDEIRSRLT
jgi:hypothetical protein